jgi:hypothetical protein
LKSKTNKETMKTHTHTAGPWYPVTLGASPDYAWAIDSELVEIARLSEWPDHKAEAEANARLIAAAPEMLEALQSLTHPMASDEDLQNALAVIAKVKGGDA